MSANATSTNNVLCKFCQVTPTFTAPAASNFRIDRVVINALTGIISVVTGTPTTGTPSPPAIPFGYLPCAQVSLASTTTAISNSQITDERNFAFLGGPQQLTTENRFVNPNMLFDLVNEGAATTPSATSSRVYVVDQWAHFATQASKLTYTGLNAPGPAGYAKCLKIAVASAFTSAATDQFIFCQPIEGCDVADLAYGGSSAQNIIVSFWIDTSVTGTYAGAIQNSATNRSYPFTFSVGSASTWTQIILSIPGDTAGTWLNGTNQIGLNFILDLGSGSNFNGSAGAWAGSNVTRISGAVSFVANTGASMFLTGFQMKAGTAYVPAAAQIFQQQYEKVMRYAEKSYDYGVALGTASANGAVTARAPGAATDIPVFFKVPKMTDATVTVYSWSTGTSGKIWDNTGSADITASTGVVGQNGCDVFNNATTAGHQLLFHWLATARL
jgi:hypothetical protein